MKISSILVAIFLCLAVCTLAYAQAGNPEPGGIGSLGPRTLTYFGQWSLDANISKNFRISESKSLQIRIDTTNVMNHPIPDIPSFTIDTLGQINGKGAQTRTFQGQVRLSF
jgi:hypothetical protein